jgi:hypothetical protein
MSDNDKQNAASEPNPNEIIQLFQEMDIPPEVLQRFVAKAQKNPMMAMVEIRKYLKPDSLPRLLNAFAKNSDAILQLAQQSGLPEHQLKNMKEVLDKNKPK